MTDTRAYLQLTIVAAFWGASWICGRIMSTEGIPALHAAVGRFAFGSAALLAIMLTRPWPRPSLPVMLRLSAMGGCGLVLYNLCFFTGLKTVPPGRASLMAALQPSVVFTFSALFWREPVTKLKIAGLLLSLAGATLVLSQGEPSKLFASGLNTGDLWVLGCVVSWVAYTLIGRTVSGRLSALASTAYSTWIGAALLVLCSLFQQAADHPWSWKAWAAAAFLGICGTAVAFLLYLQSINQIGPARASIFVNLVPVFGVLFSSLLLGESIGLATLAGGFVVICGVRVLNYR
ncbi:MAG TPA: DMT family transporter [Bryobacteraceae bacterium]|nr:DMT family transporter [Bryobacteraceae bacterium]